MPTYDVPGVYIEEQTNPGVITGVGTSTAAFIGPALRGPMNEPRRISSFDEFLALYADVAADGSRFPYIVEPRPFYMAHAVRGFYDNGGKQAYIVRVGTGVRASRQVNNVAGEPAFTVRAQKEGTDGNNIAVGVELSSRPRIAQGQAQVTAPPAGGGTSVDVNDATRFRTGDIVTKTNGADRATITQIQGQTLTLDVAIAGLAQNDSLLIANIIPAQTTFRVTNASAFRADETVLISGEDAAAAGSTVTEPAAIQSVDTATNIVTLKANPVRAKTYKVDAGTPAATLAAARPVVVGSDSLTPASGVGTSVTVNNASVFRIGDFVTEDNTARAKITNIQGNVLTLDVAIPGLAPNDTLRVANITPTQTTLRVSDLTDLVPGGVVRIEGLDPAGAGTNPATPNFAIIASIDPATKTVTLRTTPARTSSYRMDVAQGSSPTLTPWEFRLTVAPPPQVGTPTVPVSFPNLSLESPHPNYIFNPTILQLIRDAGVVGIDKPAQPPVTVTFPGRLVTGGTNNLSLGADDLPAGVNFTHYQAGLDLLKDVDDVNLVCIPDAAADPGRQVIQLALTNHCIAMKDRFAILDSAPGVLPSGPNSVEDQRNSLGDSDNGFAALYYPWLKVVEPILPGSFPPPIPRTMLIPPSGHMAGVYARTDQERGVHKAPANTAVRGVLGLERVLSDGQHGPLNDPDNINVLRVFPGSGQVMVWGARTTANKNNTDWRYINVRRLMLFLEESIEESLKFSAVFEPNNLALWGKLKRILNEFLERVWRDGALFGAKPEQAFRVRIDEALNPASTRALGRLYIEISVAAVRPAEFIIIRIGLSRDGASEVSEG